jgi:DNA-binding NtrC family response regulator
MRPRVEVIEVPVVAGGGGGGGGMAFGAVEAGPPPDATVVYRAGMTMADVERAAIEAALKETRGNRRRAAELLGIGERTLYRKLKEYALV